MWRNSGWCASAMPPVPGRRAAGFPWPGYRSPNSFGPCHREDRLFVPRVPGALRAFVPARAESAKAVSPQAVGVSARIVSSLASPPAGAIMYFLKDGGRAAVVCLPDGVFNPYTGIRSKRLFFVHGYAAGCVGHRRAG